MKKLIFLLCAVFFLTSCSFLTEEEVTLNLPSSIPVEAMSGESIYYTLFYFDGEGIRSLHVPSHVRKVKISVKKGRLSLFLIYPAEGFTPLSSYHEPGMDRSVSSFCFSSSSLIEFLMDIALYSSEVVGNLSLSPLLSCYSGDEISKSRFLSLLESGKLSLSSDLKGELFEVKLENLIYGRWTSDRDDISDVVVSSGEVTLSLYEGSYVFIHEDMSMIVNILVLEDGSSVSKVAQFPSWY